MLESISDSQAVTDDDSDEERASTKTRRGSRKEPRKTSSADEELRREVQRLRQQVCLKFSDTKRFQSPFVDFGPKFPNFVPRMQA